MILDRSNIIEELFRFSQEGNGVIIGKPGIGKSYSLAELAEHLSEQNIPALIIPIDILPDGSDASIEAEIETEGDWISYIDKVKLNGDCKAVLIFDGFDAARDEDFRKQILKQITQAISRLKKWNVIVSVRTYDATKSPRLLKLFGNQNYGGQLACRHYEIIELTENELGTAFDSNQGLKEIYINADQKLKDVLRIPFFLKLLENVLENANLKDIEELRVIHSQAELLNIYWKLKITNTENSYKKEALLKRIANDLVQSRSMSCLKDPFLKDEERFKELRSDDFINEVGVGQRHVSFSHNILFDYTVGRVIISTEPRELLGFIDEDKSRPFFLRPSFIFHFTQLWYHHRSTFWKNFTFLSSQQESSISLFNRLIPVSVIANEFESINDIKPVVEEKECIKQILQSIRFLSDRKIGGRDVELLHELSSKLDMWFLWDYAFVLEKILRDENLNQKQSFEKIGMISRSLLRFIFNERQERPQNRQALDRLGSTKGIEFISKTFNSNPEESIQLLGEVLDLLNEDNFEIWYFTSLCDELKYFIADAPEFVSEVYNRIFSHTETSDDKTSMGSVALSLISNRRQDYEMCYFSLVERYPDFLNVSPKIAIETGLRIVNNYIKKDKLFLVDGYRKTSFIVKVKDFRTYFLPDLSSMWYHDKSGYDDKVKLANKIIEFFECLVKEDRKDELIQSLGIYISNAEVAFLWNKLIEFGNQYTELFSDYLYEILLNPIILKSSSTTYEAGNLLQNIYPLLEKGQRRRLEQTILDILNAEGKKEDAEHTVSRLLNCIPREFLQEKEALTFLENTAVVKNEPTFKISWSSEPYTTDLWLEEQGVDLGSKTNREIYDQLNVLEEFNRKFLNKSPIREDFVEFLPVAENLFKEFTVTKKYDQALEFSVLKEIASFYSIITRYSSQIEDDDYINAKKAILFCLEYISKIDETIEPFSSPSAGYSPTPRTEASGALIGLYAYRKDEEILDEIKKHAVDPNPNVRFNSLRNITVIWQHKSQEFWDIILERLSNETDSFTMSTILNNVLRKEIIDADDKINQIIILADKRINEFGKRDAFKREYTSFLLYLIKYKENEIAKKIVYNHLEDIDFIQVLILQLFDNINPKLRGNDYTVYKTNEDLIQLLKDIAISNLENLKKGDPEKFNTEGSQERERLLLIDTIMQHMYFSLDIRERNRKENEVELNVENKKAFYNLLKPIILEIVDGSKKVGTGIMVAHTAHYLIQTLNGVLKFHPNEARSILELTFKITELSDRTGYTFDSSSIKEVVMLSEIFLADHKEILREAICLDHLISILNIYIERGWTEGLELLWKLDEVFR